MLSKNKTLLIIITVLFCSIPFLLNQLGFQFSTANFYSPLLQQETAVESSQIAIIESITGKFHHAFIEWISICIALIAAVACFIHFYRTKDISAPIIAIILIFTAVMDIFHVITVSNITLTSSNNSNLIALTWTIARLFNIVLIVVGIAFQYYLHSHKTNNHFSFANSLKTMAFMAIVFSIVASVVINWLLNSESLPDTLYPFALIKKPYDALVLILFILTAVAIWNWNKSQHSALKFSLLVAIIPAIFSQFHISFSSTSLYDSEYNIAHILKTISYFILFSGVLWDMAKSSKEKTEESQAKSLKALSFAGKLNVGKAKYPQSVTIPLIAFTISITITFLVAFSFYKDTKSLITEYKNQELMVEGALVEPLIKNFYTRLYNDVLFLSKTPPINGIMNAIETNNFEQENVWKDRFKQILESILQSRNDYLKIRFVGIHDSGKELVNVFKNNTGVYRTPDSKLLTTSTEEYFLQIKAAESGKVGFSSIELYKQQNKLREPHLPELKAYTPIFHPQTEKLFGFIIINANVNHLYNDLKNSISQSLTLFIVNENGDYLYHPDNSKRFGFDLNNRHFIYQEFEFLKPLFESEFQHQNLINKNKQILNANKQKQGFFQSIHFDDFEDPYPLYLFLTFDKEMLESELSGL